MIEVTKQTINYVTKIAIIKLFIYFSTPDFLGLALTELSIIFVSCPVQAAKPIQLLVFLKLQPLKIKQSLPRDTVVSYTIILPLKVYK